MNTGDVDTVVAAILRLKEANPGTLPKHSPTSSIDSVVDFLAYKRNLR